MLRHGSGWLLQPYSNGENSLRAVDVSDTDITANAMKEHVGPKSNLHTRSSDGQGRMSLDSGESQSAAVVLAAAAGNHCSRSAGGRVKKGRGEGDFRSSERA